MPIQTVVFATISISRNAFPSNPSCCVVHLFREDYSFAFVLEYSQHSNSIWKRSDAIRMCQARWTRKCSLFVAYLHMPPESSAPTKRSNSTNNNRKVLLKYIPKPYRISAWPSFEFTEREHTFCGLHIILAYALPFGSCHGPLSSFWYSWCAFGKTTLTATESTWKKDTEESL